MGFCSSLYFNPSVHGTKFRSSLTDEHFGALVSVNTPEKAIHSAAVLVS